MKRIKLKHYSNPDNIYTSAEKVCLIYIGSYMVNVSHFCNLVHTCDVEVIYLCLRYYAVWLRRIHCLEY